MLSAWREFLIGKSSKKDVIKFSANVEKHILDLHNDLKSGNYQHGGYIAFYLRDPKLRQIHKASVRDRLLHHAVFRVLYPFYDKKFIFDSFSSRVGKGTYEALKRFRKFAWKISRNKTKIVWILKCDIRKFFDSVNHDILIRQIERHFGCKNELMNLTKNIIFSFGDGCGIPLGNLTSQLYSNIYLNDLDYHLKFKLQIKYYVRYADDFVVLSDNKQYLEKILIDIREFLKKELMVNLHEDKISILKWNQGIDFLGYVLYPDKTMLRTKTNKRMTNRLIAQVTELDFDVQLNALFARTKHNKVL